MAAKTDFVDGAVLTAAQLNALGKAINNVDENKMNTADAQEFITAAQKEADKAAASADEAAATKTAMDEAIATAAASGSEAYVAAENQRALAAEAEISEDVTELEQETVKQKDKKIIYVGSNLISAEGSGTNWSYSDGAYTHSGTTTDVLTFDLDTTIGKSYLVSFTTNTSSYGENKLNVRIGDCYPCDAYNGNTSVNIGIISEDGGKPNIEFSGSLTISNVMVREIVSEEDAVSSVPIYIYNNQGKGMSSNITGWWNIAIGDAHTQGSIINASRNIAIGLISQQKLISGERNVSMGTYSMSLLEYGYRNIAIGADSLYKAKVCHDAVAIGKESLAHGDVEYNETVGIGTGANSRNGAISSVAIGHWAGSNIGTILTNCIAIGKEAQIRDKNATWTTNIELENSIAIGYQARANKSNQVVIGNQAVEEFCLGWHKLIFNYEHDDSSTPVSVTVGDTGAPSVLTVATTSPIKLHNVINTAELPYIALKIDYSDGSVYRTSATLKEGAIVYFENMVSVTFTVNKGICTATGVVSFDAGYGTGSINWEIHDGQYQG